MIEVLETRSLLADGIAALPGPHFVVAGVHLLARVRETYHGFVAYFNDPNTKTQDFHAFIDWGDGSKHTPGHIHGRGDGRYAVVGSHRYVKEALLPVTVTIRAPTGQKLKAHSLVHVEIPAKE
jgi:hypothetical protein